MEAWQRFTALARRAVLLAQQEAVAGGSQLIGAEHLLLGVLAVDGGRARQVLTELGVPVDALIAELREGLDQSEAGRARAKGPSLSPEAQQALRAAWAEAQALGHEEVGTEHLLVGLLRQGLAAGAGVLDSRGVDAERVRQAIAANPESPEAESAYGLPGPYPEGTALPIQASSVDSLTVRGVPLPPPPLAEARAHMVEGPSLPWDAALLTGAAGAVAWGATMLVLALASGQVNWHLVQTHGAWASVVGASLGLGATCADHWLPGWLRRHRWALGMGVGGTLALLAAAIAPTGQIVWGHFYHFGFGFLKTTVVPALGCAGLGYAVAPGAVSSLRTRWGMALTGLLVGAVGAALLRPEWAAVVPLKMWGSVSPAPTPGIWFGPVDALSLPLFGALVGLALAERLRAAARSEEVG